MRAISASSETPRVTGSSAKENESPSVFPTEELSAVRSALLLWYRKNKRILPWRDTGDPEDVWISEIMLQQTRVEAVKGYFTRFREALPDAFAIAACPEDRLMKLWEGLGYYNRARNLQKCAEVLVRDYGGKLPADHEALLRLPGIGSYTAGAIASIAFGIPVPAVDGNVLRVWSRLTNNADDISLEATKQKFTSEIRPLLEADNSTVCRAFDAKIEQTEARLREIRMIRASYQNEMNEIQRKISEVREKIMQSMNRYDATAEFGIDEQQYAAICGNVEELFNNLAADPPKDIEYIEFSDGEAAEEEEEYLDLLHNSDYEIVYEKHGWEYVKDFFREFDMLEDGAEYALIFQVTEDKERYNTAFGNTILGVLLARNPNKRRSLSCNMGVTTDGENHFWLLKK